MSVLDFVDIEKNREDIDRLKGSVENIYQTLHDISKVQERIFDKLKQLEDLIKSLRFSTHY